MSLKNPFEKFTSDAKIALQFAEKIAKKIMPIMARVIKTSSRVNAFSQDKYLRYSIV